MSYTKAKQLGFIEQSEYLRQRCRNEALAQLDDADAQDLLSDPNKETDEIYTALVAVLLGIILPDVVSATQEHVLALGLAEVTNEEASSVVEDAIGEFESTEQEFSERLTEADERLRDSGQSDATILATIESKAGREGLLSNVSGFLQGAMAGAVALVEQGIQDLAKGKASQSSPSMLLRWHATGDGKSCDGDVMNSCEPRDGMEKTLEQWTALGLPAPGNLICSIYSRSGLPQCRCELGAANVQRLEPGVTNATEAIKSGRDRANGAN